ncbi:MAG: TetR/AcrR family transcriptional regulator [Burkholderiales bacterium]|nr:TetR/AcrR family transcriptional regulator [Burkholderiales bacterium]
MKPITSTPMSSEDRRAATVSAVVELASEHNPTDITTAAIAAKMGVTQGALFRHFASKDAVLSAVMEWVSARLLGRLEAAADGLSQADQALEAMFMAHIQFIVEHPGVPRLMLGELQKSGDSLPKRLARTLSQAYRSRLSDKLKLGVEQGIFRADLDIEASTTLLFGMVQGLAVQGLLSADVAGIKDEAPRLFLLFRRAIAN